MTSFHILKRENDAKYRLGFIQIPNNFLSMYDGNDGQSPDINCEYGNKIEAGVGFKREPIESGATDFAKVFTPAISIPTMGGLPYCILPRIEANLSANSEISSILPEIDYLLVGHSPDIERIRRREKSGYSIWESETPMVRRGVNANKFDVLVQPKPQLAKKDYLMYMMFRQPLLDGVSCWNGQDGLFMQTNSGKVQVSLEDFITSVRHFGPAFFTAPAEESLTGVTGKNTSFRSISRADETLLKLLNEKKYLVACKYRERRGSNNFDGTNSVAVGNTIGFGTGHCLVSKNFPRNEDGSFRDEMRKTKIIANIQGAHYESYRAAASLGVWDLCKGTGIGLKNVRFASNGDVGLKMICSESSATAKEFDNLILGVTIGGVGYSEDSSTRARCVNQVVHYLPEDKVRILSLCIGSPIELLQAIYLGIDIIESPYVYKSSQAGIALTYDFDGFFKNGSGIGHNCEEKGAVKRFLLKTDFSSTEPLNKSSGSFGGAKYIYLGNREYSCDSDKITKNSPVSYSRAYIHHLINSREMLGFSLLFMHNYWQYQGLLSSIRKAIFNEKLEEFVTWFMYTQTDFLLHPVKLPEPVLETYTFDGMKGNLC